MRHAIFILLAGSIPLMAGCDQNNGSHVTVKDKDGNVTISANGRRFTMQSADGKNGSVTISGNGEHFTMSANDGHSSVEINGNGVNVSAKLPGFVAVYPGAKVTTSATGSDAKSTGGTLVMETSTPPADVISFYRRKAEGAGFKQTLSMDQGGTLVYAASEGEKQLQVLATHTDAGTHAQVTWSGQ